MKSANEVLETERLEGRLGERNMEIVGEGALEEEEEEKEGGYIEMDLGLGVLEEKRRGGKRGYEEDQEEDDEECERGEASGESLGVGDALGDMMGKKRGRGKGRGEVGIEEVRS